MKRAFTLAFVVAAASATYSTTASAGQICKWVKADRSCWGDTCRMKKVCFNPAGSYRPGMSTSVEGRAAGRTSGALGPWRPYRSGAYRPASTRF